VRVGIGYDSHRLTEERRLILGGVHIPHERGLAGHSDGDAVTHALADAILGAAAAGDLGALFPSSDPKWRDADSMELLRQAHARVRAAGYNFRQGDVTVVLEQPPLAPHVQAMKERLAQALDVNAHVISIKAKTNDGMGWIGRGEGVAVIAVAVLE
jgi:2-C-methyl-D-erythritol 2,4-cyclodiphosphate synthase